MLRRTHPSWTELSRVQRAGILVAGAVQVALQAAALWDMRQRRAEELRGSRRWWVVASFVNFLGPVAYFAAGRRRTG